MTDATMTDLTTIHQLARPEVRGLPVYNAGLSTAAVRERYGVRDVVRLGSNENPYGPGPAVARALGALAAGVGNYPDANCGGLRRALAEQTGIAPESIMVGNGSEDLLQLLCLAFLSPGDRVVTLRPSFGLHEIYPRMMGATVDMVEVTPDFAFDVPAWERALAAPAKPAKLVFLPNPSNPVGCMLGDEDLRRIVQAVPDGAILVLDEAYCEYAAHSPGYAESLAVLADSGKPWIALRTFSKAWGLAGLRVGYGLCSSSEPVDVVNRVRTPFNVNVAAQLAALAALADTSHMEDAVERTVAERERVAEELRLRGLRVAPSAGNFLFMDLARPSEPVFEALLAHGIITKPWKESGYETCLRVSIGRSQDSERFLAALDEALDAVQPHAH